MGLSSTEAWRAQPAREKAGRLECCALLASVSTRPASGLQMILEDGQISEDVLCCSRQGGRLVGWAPGGSYSMREAAKGGPVGGSLVDVGTMVDYLQPGLLKPVRSLLAIPAMMDAGQQACLQPSRAARAARPTLPSLASRRSREE